MALKAANYFFIFIISIEASVWIASALEGSPDAGVAMISTLTSTKGLDSTESDKSFDTSSFVQQPSQLELPEPHTISYRTHDQNVPKNDPVLASETAKSMLSAQSGPTDGESTQTPKKGRRDPSDQKNNSISTDSDSSSSAFPKWIIGLGLAVLACAFNALGFVFQRRGHQSMENKCPWLVGGLLMLAAGGLLDFASLGFAAQSLVAATGGLTLVCNVIFARTVLNEPVSARVLIGTLVVLCGCGITVAFSSHHSDARTGEELADLLKEPKAIIYFIISDGMILLSVGAIILMESLYFTPEHRTGCVHTFCTSKQSTTEEPAPREPAAPCGLTIEIPVTPSCTEQGSGMGCPGNIPEHAVEPKSFKDDGADVTDASSSFSPQKDGLVRPWTEGMADDPRVVNLHGVLHSWVSGIAGSQSVLFGKICAEILVNAADEAEFHYYVFFCSAVGMGLFVWLQLHSMNRGLKYHQTVLIVPAYQTFWTLGGIACGAAIFDEFSGAAVSSLIAYPLGMIVMLGGVWMLIISQQSSQMGHEVLTNDTTANQDIRTLPYNPDVAI